jgi:nucleoside-diphosphate-sugar epimerase
MKIAIIGSTSFLGQFLIKEFVDAQYLPTLFGSIESKDYSELPFKYFRYPHTLLDYNLLYDFDVIIYTAGAGIQSNLQESSELIYELNSFIPIRIQNALFQSKFKGKFITFGSYFEIGNELTDKSFSEEELVASSNLVPNHYCASKRILSRYLNSCYQTIDFYHLILPNIYGKGENESRIIPYLLNAIQNDTDIKLTSGLQYRQYIHATDIAKTVLDIANGNYSKGLYNLCNDSSVQIKDLVKSVFLVTGNEHRYIEEKLFGTAVRTDTAMPYLRMNNAKAKQTFSFQPQISINEGIKSYLE